MLPGDFPSEKQARQRFLLREQDMREARKIKFVDQTSTFEFEIKLEEGDSQPGGFGDEMSRAASQRGWEHSFFQKRFFIKVPALNRNQALKRLKTEILGESVLEAASRVQVMSNEGLWNLNFQIEREDLAPGGFFSRIAAEFSRKGWKFERAMFSIAVEVPAKSKGEALKMLNKELVRAS